MNSTSRLVQDVLLSSGYFPKELPPVFTTHDFGKHSHAIILDWKKKGVFKTKETRKFARINGKKFAGKYGFEKIPCTEPEIISKPKKLYERRNIHITHPVPQALLVKEIAENWKTIQKWLSNQTFSEDEIVASSNYERGIKGINFPLHRAKTDFIEATSDWLVKTDITRFYPSLYTHSISWAAYGKENVKSNVKKYAGSVADRLDILVRNCNRNQTIGIPIGPETSRIIAEIISSRIDTDFKDFFKINCNNTKVAENMVDRLQDDWVIGTSSLDDAEKLLSGITKCYREYGLEINGAKTSVTHLLKSDDPHWKSEIASFLSHRYGALSGGRLVEFFALCLRLQLNSPSDPVLNYALSVIENNRFRSDDLQAVETFLLKAAAIAPISLNHICRIILNIEHDTGNLSKNRLIDRFVNLAERHFENNSYYEVIWLLFTIRGLKKPFVSKRIMELSESAQSSAIRLLLLEMDQSGFCIRRPPKETWQREISADRCASDWTWLYAYEAVRKGWLTASPSFLRSPFIEPMHSRSIVFYDPKRNISRSASAKRNRNQTRKAQNLEVAQLVSQMRGVKNLDFFDQEY